MRSNFYRDSRDGYLNEFRKAASGLRGTSPPVLTVDEWWALGRHFGLTTPLLDWSESPYIAAFFALSELLTLATDKHGMITMGGQRRIAIYRLFDNGQLERNELRILRPTVDELGRMHSQQGLFTWLDSEDFFELQGYLDNTGRGDLLTQITIADNALFDGLRDLRNHGISYRLIFPDLEGAAKHANTRAWPFFA